MSSSGGDKAGIARSFAEAAASYDAHAHLQRHVADHLMSRISARPAGRILDLGSGTSYCGWELKKRFPQAEAVNLDIAEGMLRYAKSHCAAGKQAWVCGDAEALPFRENSFDLAVSSLTLQWCPRTSDFFAELNRVMKPDCPVHISTLTEGTLQELEQAWRGADSFAHVNSFHRTESLCQQAQKAGFMIIRVEEHERIEHCQSLEELRNSLKGIGASNINRGRTRGLTGKSRMRKFRTAFEAAFVPGRGIPVTYRIMYMELASIRLKDNIL